MKILFDHLSKRQEIHGPEKAFRFKSIKIGRNTISPPKYLENENLNLARRTREVNADAEENADANANELAPPPRDRRVNRRGNKKGTNPTVRPPKKRPQPRLVHRNRPAADADADAEDNADTTENVNADTTENTNAVSKKRPQPRLVRRNRPAADADAEDNAENDNADNNSISKTVLINDEVMRQLHNQGMDIPMAINGPADGPPQYLVDRDIYNQLMSQMNNANIDPNLLMPTPRSLMMPMPAHMQIPTPTSTPDFSSNSQRNLRSRNK